jgi:hypothetical protein
VVTVIRTGLKLKKRKFVQSREINYTYFYTVYEVFKQTSFCGIPLKTELLAAFGDLDDALLYIREQ